MTTIVRSWSSSNVLELRRKWLNSPWEMSIGYSCCSCSHAVLVVFVVVVDRRRFVLVVLVVDVLVLVADNLVANLVCSTREEVVEGERHAASVPTDPSRMIAKTDNEGGVHCQVAMTSTTKQLEEEQEEQEEEDTKNFVVTAS